MSEEWNDSLLELARLESENAELRAELDKWKKVERKLRETYREVYEEREELRAELERVRNEHGPNCPTLLDAVRKAMSELAEAKALIESLLKEGGNQ